MIARQFPITSGKACGAMVTEVKSNSGKLLGFIRVIFMDFGPEYDCGSRFIVYRTSSFRYKVCGCLADAYKYLGVSRKELDNSDLGKDCFTERAWK